MYVKSWEGLIYASSYTSTTASTARMDQSAITAAYSALIVAYSMYTHICSAYIDRILVAVEVAVAVSYL